MTAFEQWWNRPMTVPLWFMIAAVPSVAVQVIHGAYLTVKWFF